LVALESSVLAQGLRPPHNREAYRRMCDAVREGRATPRVTAVVRGRLTTDLDGEDLERFLTAGAPKVSARDLPFAIATGSDGATTVAATLAICAAEGIDVFATGGIGGVHRTSAGGHSFDESADLLALSRARVITVCAGAKSILDLAATLERLETYGVSVVGFGTDEFPGFFTRRTGLPVGASTDSPEVVARMLQAAPGGILVVQPPPEEFALDESVVDEAVKAAVREAESRHVSGPALTPFLLATVESATRGDSIRANLALLEANARLAARIAVALRG
jgi:pseudouridine-5'-phosphate glycosidase